MRVIDPIEVTDERLIETNVDEDGYDEYDSSATYSKGERVQVTDSGVHKVYESLQDDNSDNYPPDNSVTVTDDSTDEPWLEVGSTNPWAMFDQTVGAVTSASQEFDEDTYAADSYSDTPQGIAVEIEPSKRFNGVALFNVWGEHADLVIRNSDGETIYSQRKRLQEGLRTATWWAYFNEPYAEVSGAVAFTDIPMSRNGRIYISIHDANRNAECGVAVIGLRRELGVSIWDTSTRIIDFSRKERDEFGNVRLVKRDFAKEVTYEVEVEFDQYSRVQRQLADLRAKPAAYEATDIVPATLVYGFYRDMQLTLSGPAVCRATIDVEGLT